MRFTAEYQSEHIQDHKDNKGCILDFVVIFRSICLAMFRLIFVLVIVAGKLVYSIGRDKELIFRFSRAISQGVTTVATTTTAAAVPDSVAIYCPPRLQNDIMFI